MKLATLQCANVRAWFSAYVAGRLGLTEWALVEVHLAKCAECQRELRRLRESGKPRRPVAWVDMVRARTSHATMAASDRFRTHARRLTGLARVLATPLRWMRSARTEWRASRPTQHRSLLARFPWSVGTAVEGNVRTAGRIVMTVCRRARSWPQRAGPVWSSRRSPTDLATLILRIGAGFMSVVLVATLWGLRAPDRPTQSAQPTTTAVPVARQADESLSPPGQDVPIQSETVPIRRPNIRRATGSPAPPRPQTEIPMPVRIPAPSDSPRTAGFPREDSGHGNSDEVTSEKAPDRDPASVIDWLLRNEQRGATKRGRNENP